MRGRAMVEGRLVALGQDGDAWGRGEDTNLSCASCDWCPITFWHIWKKYVAFDGEGLSTQKNKRPVWQIGQIRIVTHLMTYPRDPPCVERRVHGHTFRRRTSRGPCRLIGQVRLPPAIVAGPVTGSESDGLIEEEQGRPSAMWHRPVIFAPWVAQRASDPMLVDPSRRPQGLVRPMDDPPITRERPARGDGDDLARGKNTVLERHLRTALLLKCGNGCREVPAPRARPSCAIMVV